MMSLVKCKECGKEISDSAKTCPHCGVRHTSSGTITAAIILAIGMAIVIFSQAIAMKQTGHESNGEKGIETLVIDKSDLVQQERQDLILKLVREGIFSDIKVPGSLPRVFVTPAFYELDFTDKQQFISVVYAYYFDGSDTGDVVRVFDSTTGKEVGSYCLTNPGLKFK